jgi:hypothetical protein
VEEGKEGGSVTLVKYFQLCISDAAFCGIGQFLSDIDDKGTYARRKYRDTRREFSESIPVTMIRKLVGYTAQINPTLLPSSLLPPSIAHFHSSTPLNIPHERLHLLQSSKARFCRMRLSAQEPRHVLLRSLEPRVNQH